LPVPHKWVSQSIALFIILGVFLLLLIGAVRHPFSSLYLNIYHAEKFTETLLYSQKVTDGELIFLSYIHSSDGTPVEQIFTVSESGTLDLLEEKYLWYGAGLEFSSEQNIAYKDGWACITGYDRAFDILPIRVASTVSQTLTIGSNEIYLADLAPAGSRLLLKVELCGLFN
jgi:hypothetical protein